MNNIQSVITVDGPSGVGKGTIARLLSQRLNYHLLDSGKIYRVVGLAAMQNKIVLNSEQELCQFIPTLNIAFKAPTGDLMHVFLNNKEVTNDLAVEQIANAASQIAQYPKVRAALLEKQQAFMQPPGLVADGRDMGTVVFPNAKVKFYLTASAEERAKRRLKQLNTPENHDNLRALESQIYERDQRDMTRAVAPLKPAADAHIIDTTNLSIENVFKSVLTLVN